MRLFTYLSGFLLSCIVLTTSAQNVAKKTIPAQKETSSPTVTLLPVIFHGETAPLRDFVEDPNIVHPVTKAKKTPGYHPKDDWPVNEYDYTNALPIGNDPKLQKDYSPALSNKALGVNITGIPSSTSPADPTVDVGPNHVVQMVNGTSGAKLRMWDKSGTTVLSTNYFDTYMNANSASGSPGWSGAGDPIVVYDARADRWLLSEFSAAGNNLYIAISTTADPTGTYYTYTVNMPSFPDYPKYSVWENEYVVTANIGSSDVVALNRTAMLAGTAFTAQKFTQSNFGTIFFQASTPVNLDGTTLPPSGTPAMVMRMRDDAWSGSASDALEIWEFDIDWVTPGNSSLTKTSTLAVSAFDSGLCGYTAFQCIPQPGTATILDPLREVLMNRIHYRNFGTHESIVCCHSVDVNGSDWAGIRWYEVRRTGGTAGTWSVYQEGTYAPDSDNRWMGSIGISASGKIGLAYNISSSSTFPSIRYTGRKDCDPLNTMTEPETVIVNGTSANGDNRYGDYNALGLDPSDGETFWFTGMYNTSASASTRIAAFSIPGCAALVQFAGTTYSVNESDANVTNGCLDYYVVNVPIQIGLDPTQVADVTVNVTGGSATQGIDYDILNTTFNFDGVTLSGIVEIRVYNDNYVEGAETISLDYTLNANGGDAAPGTINQTVSITINDDDFAPVAMTTASTVLSEDFEAGFGGFTTNNAAAATPWQIGNTAAATSAYFVVPTTNTSQFAWINDDDCNCNQNDVDLTFPSVDLTGFTSANLTFDAFYQNATYAGNTEVATLSVSISGGAFTSIAALAGDPAWTQRSFDISAYIGNNDVVFNINYSDATGWLYGCTIDNVLIEGNGPLPVQTAVNTGAQTDAYLGPNGTVHFYDQVTQNVMMTLTNTSGFDYGCVSVEVDRDGSTPTAVQFVSPSAGNFIHSKSFKVSPANSNPSGTFDIALYYKEAEVAAWESATGNSRNNLEVIKVAGNNAISDVNSGNYATFTIDNVPATMASYNSDLTFSASFSNGFSGFGLGVYVANDINEEVLPGVSLYPNPNKGEFTLTGVEIGVKYEIFDATGKLILSNTVTSSTEEVKLPSVETGNYFMTTINKNGKTGSIQFYVESK